MSDTTEAVIAAITGTLQQPRSLLFGRYDSGGALHYVRSSTWLTAAVARSLGELLTAADERHPWHGQALATRWSCTPRQVTLVKPELIAEVGADVSPDTAGRWRRRVRLHRIRADLTAADIRPRDISDQ